jgi:hypothetical protein
VNSEQQRREIAAQICVGRDLLDRVEICLLVEWKENAAPNLLSYSHEALIVAQKELLNAAFSCAQLREQITQEENALARPK